VDTVSVAQLGRYVVAHQGYTSRFRRARAADVEAAVRRLRVVQLDSISTVDRAHRLTLTSRIGAYSEPAVSRMLNVADVMRRPAAFRTATVHSPSFSKAAHEWRVRRSPLPSEAHSAMTSGESE